MLLESGSVGTGRAAAAEFPHLPGFHLFLSDQKPEWIMDAEGERASERGFSASAAR